MRGEDERAAVARAGADLVDLESVAFAEIATDRGWRWAIVRGVSDDAGSPLPAGVESWVDRRGRSRPLRTAGAVVRHPAMVASLVRLGATAPSRCGRSRR